MSNDLDILINHLAKLPGLGKRSARRVALHLLKQKTSLMLPLAKALQNTAEAVSDCGQCGNLDTVNPCHICADPKRDPHMICVVEEVGDIWAFERCNIYRGMYHVLGGVLSAIDGVSPSDLTIGLLQQRIQQGEIREVILATNATMDGQTTAHYISEVLAGTGVTITHLAHGIPIGGELDYLDEGTLSAALHSRRSA